MKNNKYISFFALCFACFSINAENTVQSTSANWVKIGEDGNSIEEYIDSNSIKFISLGNGLISVGYMEKVVSPYKNYVNNKLVYKMDDLVDINSSIIARSASSIYKRLNSQNCCTNWVSKCNNIAMKELPFDKPWKNVFKIEVIDNGKNFCKFNNDSVIISQQYKSPTFDEDDNLIYSDKILKKLMKYNNFQTVTLLESNILATVTNKGAPDTGIEVSIPRDEIKGNWVEYILPKVDAYRKSLDS